MNEVLPRRNWWATSPGKQSLAAPTSNQLSREGSRWLRLRPRLARGGCKLEYLSPNPIATNNTNPNSCQMKSDFFGVFFSAFLLVFTVTDSMKKKSFFWGSYQDDLVPTSFVLELPEDKLYLSAINLAIWRCTSNGSEDILSASFCAKSGSENKISTRFPSWVSPPLGGASVSLAFSWGCITRPKGFEPSTFGSTVRRSNQIELRPRYAQSRGAI